MITHPRSREELKVYKVEYCRDNPEKATLYYNDYRWGYNAAPQQSNLKIYNRKDNSQYVVFENNRYNLGYGVVDEYTDCWTPDGIRRIYYIINQ